jgi:hypothetical protein
MWRFNGKLVPNLGQGRVPYVPVNAPEGRSWRSCRKALTVG